MTDLLVKNCLLLQKKAPQDILIKEGVIKDIASKITVDSIPTIDADFHFVTPPFVDSHFHMDATLSYGLPRVNKSGTLLEGIRLWGELKPNLTADAIKERALKFCKWAIARGTLAIRSHVDVSGQNLVGVEALLDVREQMKDFIDIQLVAFPQDGLFRANCLDNLKAALDMGVDVVGGLELGAVPLTGIAIAKAGIGSNLRGFIMRKEPKGRGGRKTGNPPGIEGSTIQSGDRVLILEDVTTTGGSALKAVERLQDMGCSVIACISIVDREEGGKEAFEAAGIPLHALTTLSDYV